MDSEKEDFIIECFKKNQTYEFFKIIVDKTPTSNVDKKCYHL